MIGASLPTRALVGQSRAMRDLRQRILQIAPTTEAVLITGESGTGKDLVARELHAASGRQALPLVRLNCAVFAPHSLECELFGQEADASPGAGQQRIGRLERADRGTLLLDEVTELPLPLQAKLRRVLDEQCFERTGGANSIAVDVRMIALSHRSLAEEIAAGRLREELYFRLAVVHIAIPPLRERREDICELLEYMLRQNAQRLHCGPCHFRPAALELLEQYNWPGNVRELENIAIRATVLHAGEAVEADVVGSWLEPVPAPRAARETLDADDRSLREIERQHIESTLERCGGHRGRTAEVLGIGARTLSAKLKEYGQPPSGKGSRAGKVVPAAHVRF